MNLLTNVNLMFPLYAPSINRGLSPFLIYFIHAPIQVVNFWNQLSLLVWETHETLVLITETMDLLLTVGQDGSNAENQLPQGD